jgi:hypothetical protein
LLKLKVIKTVVKKITILNNKELFFINLIYLKGIKATKKIENKDKNKRNKTIKSI